jgi:hypothetical protein
MKHGHNNWHLGEVKYGVHVPNNVHEAFALNQENGNTYWANAIALEMNALKKMGCFKIPPPNGILKLRVSSMPPPGLSLMSRVPQEKGSFGLWQSCHLM